MYYLVNQKTIPKHEEFEYYELSDLERVEIIEWPKYNPEDPDNWPLPEGDDGYWWPLYSGVMSTVPVEAKDIDEAREMLLENLNEALYEQYHGI